MKIWQETRKKHKVITFVRADVHPEEVDEVFSRSANAVEPAEIAR